MAGSDSAFKIFGSPSQERLVRFFLGDRMSSSLSDRRFRFLVVFGGWRGESGIDGLYRLRHSISSKYSHLLCWGGSLAVRRSWMARAIANKG